MKDIYLKFTPKSNSKAIPGASGDSDHKGWLELNDFSFGIIQPKSATTSSSGGHTAERCQHGDLAISKEYDKSSVYLWEACSAGYAYDVEIQCYRASGTTRTNYLTIKLTNAIVASTHAAVPHESFALKYEKVVWTHRGSSADGSANVGNDVGGWDLAGNKAAA